MGNYLILLYQDEAAQDAAGEEERQALHAAHQRFQAAHGDVLRGGAWLARSATATAVRPAGAHTVPDFTAGADAAVTDGPYVETKEALGGYYVAELPDLDAALALAKEVPCADGGLEVRPMFTS